MEKLGNKQDEESAKDWKLLFELYEILKKRVDDREEKMRDYVRKVGLTEKEKSKDERRTAKSDAGARVSRFCGAKCRTERGKRNLSVVRHAKHDEAMCTLKTE